MNAEDDLAVGVAACKRLVSVCVAQFDRPFDELVAAVVLDVLGALLRDGATCAHLVKEARPRPARDFLLPSALTRQGGGLLPLLSRPVRHRPSHLSSRDLIAGAARCTLGGIGHLETPAQMRSCSRSGGRHRICETASNLTYPGPVCRRVGSYSRRT